MISYRISLNNLPSILILLLLLLLLLLSPTSAQLHDHKCRSTLNICTEMVQPYLKNPAYMFPTSLENVNEMCKMWSRFVDCIRKYIGACFEENRRVLFHKSVENSIDTVHAICSSKVYQNEYLKKATCFKQVSMDYCGRNYQTLIDVISNRNSNDEHICCAYAQFKQCVNQPLFEDCGRKAKNLMDHSMSFLISRCNHYSYQIKTDCPKLEVNERKQIDDMDAELLNGQARDSSSIIGARLNEPNIQQQQQQQTDNVDPFTMNVNNVPQGTSTTPPSSSSSIITVTSLPITAESTTINSNEPEESNVHGKRWSNQTPDNVETNKADNNEDGMNMENNNDTDESGSEMIVYTLRPESQISYSTSIMLNESMGTIISIILTFQLTRLFL